MELQNIYTVASELIIIGLLVLLSTFFFTSIVTIFNFITGFLGYIPTLLIMTGGSFYLKHKKKINSKYVELRNKYSGKTIDKKTIDKDINKNINKDVDKDINTDVDKVINKNIRPRKIE